VATSLKEKFSLFDGDRQRRACDLTLSLKKKSYEAVEVRSAT